MAVALVDRDRLFGKIKLKYDAQIVGIASASPRLWITET